MSIEKGLTKSKIQYACIQSIALFSLPPIPTLSAKKYRKDEPNESRCVWGTVSHSKSSLCRADFLVETAEKVQQIDGAILINTARGGLIDEQALYDALMQRKLYTAALDVVKKNRPSAAFLWWTAPLHHHRPYCMADKGSPPATVDLQIQNLQNDLDGHPTSIINGWFS